MPDDVQRLAEELNALLRDSGGDPLSLLRGAWSFHSCFIAPFTPSFAEARQQFLIDGGGPLSTVAEQLRAQGLPAEQAVATARQLVGAAQGLCVAVLAGEHGVFGVPQPWFGGWDARWREGAAQVLQEPLRRPFADALAALAQRAARWPRAVAGPALAGGDVRDYWLELAHGVAQAAELLPAALAAPQADLGHWVGAAVQALAPADLDAADHAALARCHLLAGEYALAGARIEACVGQDDEAVVELLDAYAAAAVARGGESAALAWLEQRGSALGCPYDVALARLRIVAAGGSEAIGEAIDRLVAADRKLARQALTREPLWRVTARDPGELLDTAAAAELLQRSPAAIAKRLEAGTIPHVVVGERQLRIPRRAVLAWQAALARHGLSG
ncbi:MAG: helix-turn-helix domain-containing protein [Planctomycetota bacterium]|nr:helix-turn-helix domain-containing protein [Planctomycetota bacterium]MCX8040405.1 helix-turn-helix domain-containing protein [Planctomycetota bacterium]MDW8372219.1 helix-turn-helix domain-containing protein [Planctomycetota bacterium]